MPSPQDAREELLRRRSDRVELARRELARRRARASLAEFCASVDPLFVMPAHVKKIIEVLEALERGDVYRVVLTVPPKHGKTYLSAERFPAWAIGRNPHWNIITASYAVELAMKSTRAARNLVIDQRYPFAVRIADDSAAAGRWQTSGGGFVLAAGVGGTMTGFGAHLLLIDDPVKDRQEADSELMRNRAWEWYQDVARTRAMPGTRLRQLIMMTRWHDDDLVGRILKTRGASDWLVVNLPAIAIENDPLGRKRGELLWADGPELPSVEKGEISPRAWSSMFMGDPIPTQGSIFRLEWFGRRYSVAPQAFQLAMRAHGLTSVATPTLVIVQSIDAAWKTGPSNSRSVIATWATDDKDYFLLDIWSRQVEYPDLVKAVAEQAVKHAPHAIYVEEAASGIGILQSFRQSTSLPLIGVKPSGSKESRAETVTPIFAAGKVVLPESAPWLDEWIEEHLRFPAGAHDDQVDTTSLALSQLMQRSYLQLGARNNWMDMSGWMSR